MPPIGSSVTGINLLGSSTAVDEQEERRSNLAKSKALTNKYKLGHAVLQSAKMSEKLAPEDVQWSLNTGDLLNRLHGKDKVVSAVDLAGKSAVV